jgi:hypothetical protein
MELNLTQIIGIILIIIMVIVLLQNLMDKQTFYNFTLPVLGKKYDLKLSTLVPGFKNDHEEASSEEASSEEASSEEASSEEPSSEEPSSEEPLVGLYKSKQLYLEQFPRMRTISNERPMYKLPDEPTMRKILEDLSNSGIIV